MSNANAPTKKQLIEIIERLQSDPDDKLGIFANIGITAFGAATAGGTAAFFGATTASIPIITAVTGISIAVAAAPVALVAGAAIAGGAALYGLSKVIRGDGYGEGKKQELLNRYEELLRETEAKERKAKLNEEDKTKFYVSLKEPLNRDLISAEDGYKLMAAVNKGQMSITEAYRLVRKIVNESKG